MNSARIRFPVLTLALAIAVSGAVSIACGGTTGQPPPAPSDAGTVDAAPVPLCALGDTLDCKCVDGTESTGVCNAAGQVGQCDCASAAPTKPKVISGGFFDAETDITATAQGVVVSTWTTIVGQGKPATAYAVSKDFGATWAPARNMPKDPAGRSQGDPVITSDALGNIYLGWMAYTDSGAGSSNLSPIIAKAPAGTGEFGEPQELAKFPKGGDKPWMAVTPKGTILMSIMEDTGPANILHMYRSEDQGVTYTDSEVYRGTQEQQANFIVPCTSPTSTRLYAAHLLVTSTGLAQWLRWSEDDGATWDPGNAIKVTSRTGPQPPSCAAQGDFAWVAYPRMNQITQQDQVADEYRVAIFDGTRISDFRADDKSRAASMIGSVYAEQLPGTLSLTYYAGTGPDDAAGELRRVRSRDYGQTWGKAETLVSGIFFTPERGTERWLGDYVAVSMIGNDFYTSYGDNGGNSVKVKFLKVPSK
jgi:hypothetical protein